MKTLKQVLLACGVAAFALLPCGASAQSASERLQQGLYAEEVEGNLTNAIRAYDAVIGSGSASRPEIAQALYRQATCYLKLKDDTAARLALEKLVSGYSDQTDLVKRASSLLEDLMDFDPAILMPPGTLAYVEFGSPGAQLETILSMLKGTPFENPLAAMGGARPSNGAPSQRSPSDIVGALLNPSMITEFKKIRSTAIGITGIANDQPPMIAVLYPGKSDALRGLIVAAIGMAGAPGQPIEGMTRVDFRNTGEAKIAVAYDDRVVIVANPASQLEWCVKQYKGAASEPSLASSKSFSRLAKSQRQRNAITVWANVDEAYAQLQKMLPDGGLPRQIQLADSLVDFKNLDDLTLSASIEPTGMAYKCDVLLKKDHRCLVYDLIHTPNIGKAALQGVPSDAVAFATFSLSQADPMQRAQAAAAVKSITGLDVGRELFANLEQVTLFVMPPAANPNANASTGSPMYIPSRLGLALTSHDPQQTRGLLRTLLGTANTLSSGSQADNSGDRFRIAANGELYCHLRQVGGITILALSSDVVDAAVAAVNDHKSVCDSGPLTTRVRGLSPTASKLVLVNAGGAIRLLAPQARIEPASDAQRQQLNDSLEQLAQAVAKANIELRTDEQQDAFGVSLCATGVPPLNQLLQPVEKIQSLMRAVRNDAAARLARSQVPASIMPAPVPPSIDGQLDEIWNAARPYALENVLVSNSGSGNMPTAEFRTLCDDSNLYVLVAVKDRSLHHDAVAEWYNDDSVEIYIDALNKKSAEYSQTDYQYTFTWDKTSPVLGEIKHQNTNGVQYALVTTPEGYRLEAKLPWTTLGTKPAAGTKIGLDVHVNDNQGNRRRDAKISWHSRTDDAWENPRSFGTAELAGLLGWWKFDETQGTTAQDSSGGNHSGTLIGNARWGKGRIGGALVLDGSSGFVRIADKSAFDLGGPFTVACWANLRSVPMEWMAIVTKGDNSWRLSTTSQEQRIHFSGIDSTRVLGANEWHHLAAVYDGTAKRLYVDGNLEAEEPVTGGFGRDDSDVLIGENAERPGRFFSGMIDDVRIYNHALSETAIKSLAAAE